MSHTKKYAAEKRVINERGEDVTPISLLLSQEDVIKLGKNTSAGFGHIGHKMSNAPSYISLMEKHFTDVALDQNLSDKLLEISKEEIIRNHMNQNAKHNKRVEIIRPERHGRFIDISLKETVGFNLLDLASCCVLEDHENIETIMEENADYERLCSVRVGNSRYVDRAMQTINEPSKYKASQTDSTLLVDHSQQVNTWMMDDEYAGRRVFSRSARADSSSIATKAAGSWLQSLSSAAVRGVTVTAVVMDNLLAVNQYRSALAAYRRRELMLDNVSSSAQLSSTVSSDRLNVDAEASEPLDSARAPHLRLLWTYGCRATDGIAVSSLCCCPSNSDLIAASYCSRTATASQPGLVCCWSVHNAQFPGRMFQPPRGVVSCDFSPLTARLLAVGCLDGSLAVYDVATGHAAPLLDTFSSQQGHVGAAWTVRFVASQQQPGTPAQRGESLMSVSHDGRVCRWSWTRGLHAVDMMTLHDQQRKQQRSGGSGGDQVLVAGLHMDFSSHDSTQYVVATESGCIQRCSTLHTERCVAEHRGHSAAVMRVRWSPWHAALFASCSLDWSVKVWHCRSTSAVLSLHSSVKAAVIDVQWSQQCATQLAFCTAHHIEVWDVGVSTLDPCILHRSTDRTAQYTCLLLHEQAGGQYVLVGNSRGEVGVLQVLGMQEDRGSDDPLRRLTHLIAARMGVQLQADWELADSWSDNILQEGDDSEQIEEEEKQMPRESVTYAHIHN